MRILECEEQRAVGLLNVKVTATNMLYQTREESFHLQLGGIREMTQTLATQSVMHCPAAGRSESLLELGISGPSTLPKTY